MVFTLILSCQSYRLSALSSVFGCVGTVSAAVSLTSSPIGKVRSSNSIRQEAELVAPLYSSSSSSGSMIESENSQPRSPIGRDGLIIRVHDTVSPGCGAPGSMFIEAPARAAVALLERLRGCQITQAPNTRIRRPATMPLNTPAPIAIRPISAPEHTNAIPKMKDQSCRAYQTISSFNAVPTPPMEASLYSVSGCFGFADTLKKIKSRSAQPGFSDFLPDLTRSRRACYVHRLTWAYCPQ